MKPTSLGDLPKEDAKKEEEKTKPDENEKRLLYQEFLIIITLFKFICIFISVRDLF